MASLSANKKGGEKEVTKARGGKKYESTLPKKMYSYFYSFCDVGAPSFSKFARSIGATLAELESFKKHKKFEKAWRECSEIRRDYLIDSALTKRHDSSFTKFILQAEYGFDESEGADTAEQELKVTLEVLEK